VRRPAVPRGALCICAAVLLGGCGGGDKPSEPLPEAAAQMNLASAAFQDGGTIPKRFTCSGRDISPPLRWSEVPRGTREFELLVEDVDADRFVHWTVLGIPSPLHRLVEGNVPPEAVETENGFGDKGWGGPCPPEGDDPHRYLFAIYAVDQSLGLGSDASPDDVRTAVAEHAVGRGTLTGRFGRE
jgi:Raf kinase inhibitor-like YbhB/YbcL family protein